MVLLVVLVSQMYAIISWLTLFPLTVNALENSCLQLLSSDAVMEWCNSSVHTLAERWSLCRASIVSGLAAKHRRSTIRTHTAQSASYTVLR